MPAESPAAPWSFATRLAFRFGVIYFSLYVLATQMLGSLIPLPVGSLPDVGRVMDGLIVWTGTHVFRVNAAFVVSGSGDRYYDWVQVFCLLVIAAAGTAVWSVLDRRRGRYERPYRWFRVFLRFALGATMMTYGSFKVIPLQMPAPTLARLVEPYGNFSPMGVLWYSVGASFWYERMVGLAELLAGALLFIPRTALAGALVALADSIMIFTLNMTFDVPVKLFSFHMILMSLFLIAPEVRRLAALVCGGAARTRWAAVVQVAFGAYIIGIAMYGSVRAWTQFGWGAPKPPLYGIWNVEKMTIDGVERPPLLTDAQRWRRLVVDRATDVAFIRLDDSVVRYRVAADPDASALTLSNPADKAWTAHLAFQRPEPERLILDGTMGGHAVHLETRLFDRAKFNLVSRGFHWVQQFPVNQ